MVLASEETLLNFLGEKQVDVYTAIRGANRSMLRILAHSDFRPVNHGEANSHRRE